MRSDDLESRADLPTPDHGSLPSDQLLVPAEQGLRRDDPSHHVTWEWGISQAQSVMLLSLVSIFLAIIGTPPVLWLQRKYIPSVIAVLLVVASMIALLLIIGVIVGTSINSFSDTLPFYQARIQEQASALKGMLASRGIEIPDTVLLKYVNPEAVMTLSVGMLAGMGSVLSNIVIILLIVSFILLEASSFPFKLRYSCGFSKNYEARR